MVQYVRMYGALAVVVASAAFGFAIIGIVVAAVRARKGQRFSPTVARVAAWVVGVACGVGTLVVTLLPTRAGGHFLGLIPGQTLVDMVANPTSTTIPQIVGNVLLLSWLGVVVPVLSTRPLTVRRVVLVGCLASVAIEALQYVTFSGRASTIDDVILNTAGVLIFSLIGVRRVAPWLRRLESAQPGRHGTYRPIQP